MHHAHRGLAKWHAEIRRKIERGELLRSPVGRKSDPLRPTRLMRKRLPGVETMRKDAEANARYRRRCLEVEEMAERWEQREIDPALVLTPPSPPAPPPALVDDRPPLCSSPWLRGQRNATLAPVEQVDVFTAYYRQHEEPAGYDVRPGESLVEAALRRIRGG
jgi:hypothetical protein